MRKVNAMLDGSSTLAETGASARATTPPQGTRETVLVFEGGGALGSYQAGVFEALAASDYTPDWVAGISIDAINCALIAGNARERRVEQLRRFWQEITLQASPWPLALGSNLSDGHRRVKLVRCADLRPAGLLCAAPPRFRVQPCPHGGALGAGPCRRLHDAHGLALAGADSEGGWLRVFDVIHDLLVARSGRARGSHAEEGELGGATDVPMSQASSSR
jgi:hypothetical protein